MRTYGHLMPVTHADNCFTPTRRPGFRSCFSLYTRKQRVDESQTLKAQVRSHNVERLNYKIDIFVLRTHFWKPPL